MSSTALTIAFVALFIVHWQVSVFLQTFFLHRYGAHRQFTMSKGWERTFHLLTFLIQGPSYLNPRAYAILHRMHHAFSDTPKDPHSPIHEPNFFKMMWQTKIKYEDVKYRRVPVDPRFDGGYPEWPILDEKLSNMPIAIAWGTVYALFYLAFVPHGWLLALLPFHWLMGPVHGAIVNWAGHKVGYRNFDSDDNSKNSLVFDVLTMGELFQNNHHKWGQSPNFAVRVFEIDPAYQIMKVLNAVGIIDMSGAQHARWQSRAGRTPVATVAPPPSLVLPLPLPAPQDGP
ncbi:MAG TPA: acyl-CoA desaturase [Polyangiaceae bacterium]|nr:acyl-CoA desaturase [Polyangiaceae bacterium]